MIPLFSIISNTIESTHTGSEKGLMSYTCTHAVQSASICFISYRQPPKNPSSSSNFLPHFPSFTKPEMILPTLVHLALPVCAHIICDRQACPAGGTCNSDEFMDSLAPVYGRKRIGNWKWRDDVCDWGHCVHAWEKENIIWDFKDLALVK